MIRGAIEIVQLRRVAGWIVVPSISLRGATVLAFSGKRCVGAGTVEIFREDLLAAKLGDGHAGFDFAIALADDQPLGSVVVRLESSDAVLIQADSEVVERQAVSSNKSLRSKIRDFA